MQKLLTAMWIGFIVSMVLAFTFLTNSWWVSLPTVAFGLMAAYLTTDYLGRQGYNLSEFYQISHMH